MMEKIKKIFSNYPKSIAYILPIPWVVVGMYLTFSIFETCSLTILTVLLCTYTFFIIPNWIGLFINIKKLHYIVGGFIWGSFWGVGMIAYVGYGCGGI